MNRLLLVVVGAVVLLGAGYWLGTRRTGPRPKATSAQVERLTDAVACGDGDKAACERTLATDRKRCDRGDMQGCVLLGITYGAGHKVPKDEAAAVPYFQRACDGNDANGCWYLGSRYEQGRGVAQDYAAAMKWYARGCELGGEVNACDSLGDLHRYGRGTPVDLAKALEAYDKGCKITTQGFACDHAAALRKPVTP